MAPHDGDAGSVVEQQRPTDRQSVPAIVLAVGASATADRTGSTARAQDLRSNYRRHRPFRLRACRQLVLAAVTAGRRDPPRPAPPLFPVQLRDAFFGLGPADGDAPP